MFPCDDGQALLYLVGAFSLNSLELLVETHS